MRDQPHRGSRRNGRGALLRLALIAILLAVSALLVPTPTNAQLANVAGGNWNVMQEGGGGFP